MSQNKKKGANCIQEKKSLNILFNRMSGFNKSNGWIFLVVIMERFFSKISITQ
jgi:hypothetical protein